MSKPDSFDQELINNQAFLRGFIASLGVLRQDIDEVLQECNLYLSANRNKFTEGSNFRAWSASVARFRCLNYFRNRKRRPHSDLSEEAIDALEMTYVENFDAINDQIDHLNRCLDRLPQNELDLLMGFHTRGENVAELASKHKISQPAARKRLSRIRQMLRQCIEKISPENH